MHGSRAALVFTGVVVALCASAPVPTEENPWASPLFLTGSSDWKPIT